MKDNSALILGDHQAGLVAGLQWQFICGADRSSRQADIRRHAATLQARSCVTLGRDGHAYAGFYLWDAAVNTVKRPGRVYSFAALLSHRLHAANAIVAWRIDQGSDRDKVAVVVTDNHLPITDVVVDAQHARSLIERHQKNPSHADPLNFWSNDLEEFPLAQPMVLDWPEIKPGRNERIRAIAALPANSLLAMGVAALVVSALLVTHEWRTAGQQESTAMQAQQRAQAAAYTDALQSRQGRLGASSRQVNQLLETWMDHPAILAAWSMTDVDCDAMRCLQTWNTQGGYTSALIDQLQQWTDARPVRQLDNARILQFEGPSTLSFSGAGAWEELPDPAALQQLLFDEQQVWSKAGIDHRIDLQGLVWPDGSQPANGQQTLKRHAVRISGPVNIIGHLLDDYAGLVWWERMRLHVRPFENRNLLQIELQGAFYAW